MSRLVTFLVFEILYEHRFYALVLILVKYYFKMPFTLIPEFWVSL